MTWMGLAGVPFTKLPKMMVIEFVYTIVFWFNFAIPEDYISNTLDPAANVLGRAYNYNMICGIGSKFGEYVQTHKKTTNTMKARTVSAICLRPTGNTQGSFYHYSLWIGRQLHRRRRTAMSQEVVDQAHYLANKQRAPAGLVFTRLDGTVIEQAEDNVSIQEDMGNSDNDTITLAEHM